jgi:hypothetical protein
MSLGDIFRTLAPIAAGAMVPGGATLLGSAALPSIAAGAATGAGIAALSGDDPLMGAFSGGLGGYSGDQLSGAASSGLAPTTTTALPTGMVDQGLSPALQNSTFSGVNANSIGTQFTPTAGVNKGISMANVTMPNTGKALGTFGDPSGSYLNRLGGGSTLMGAGKLGAIGLPVIGAAAMPDYNQTEDPRSKYDPTRRLNLGMTTGIQNAMNRDSGLRLNQFEEGGYVEDYLYSDPVRRDQFGEMLEGIKSIPRNIREGTQFYLDQYREKKQNEAAEQQFRDDYPELQRQIQREKNNMAQGGYLETGMGDGMSDDIPSSIDGEQPAALSEGEFVVPADVVSHIGNGSSDAGAEQLYAMMDRIRKARTGNKEQGREIMPQEYMPA